MKIVLFNLALLLIAKDTAQLNDPFVMRGSAQALCLALGAIWLLNHLSLCIIRKYWILAAYLLDLTLSSVYSIAPIYVLFQVLSLTAVILFFIAYFESGRHHRISSIQTIVHITVGLYIIIALLSLIVFFTHPDIAYGAVKNGWSGQEFRFRGLFSKAGMLASAMGLTIGLVWFVSYPPLIKIPAIGIAGVCLFMTFSRTYWVALLIALPATYWIFEPKLRKRMSSLAIVVVMLLIIVQWVGNPIDFKNVKFLRADSITSLTGRVSIWEEGIKSFYRRPLLGYGYTTGASGLEHFAPKRGFEEADINSSRNIGRVTLHNGFLQSLLDSGIIGTLLYGSIIFSAVWLLSKKVTQSYYKGPFYVLIFKCLCNFSENSIYSASVFDSVLFFAFAVLAFGSRDEVSHVDQIKNENMSRESAEREYELAPGRRPVILG